MFVSICLFAYLVNFGRVAFAPLVQPFMDIFEVREATAGFVATTVWLGSAVSRLPTGVMLTRVKRHHAIVGMGIFMTGAAAATALAPGIALVSVGAFLIGLASGVFYIAANPLVSELYPSRVGWAVGIRGMSAQLAAVSAPALVGVTLIYLSWRHVFAGIAVVAVLATGLFFLAARRAEMPEAGAEDRDLLAAAREQWPLILTGIAVVGITGFVWQGLFNFYESYLEAIKQVPSGTASNLLTLIFAAGVPAFFLSGRMADRVPYIPLMVVILSTFVVCLLTLTVVEGVLAIAALSVVMGFVIHSLFPVLDTYMLATLPDHRRGSAYAVFSATMMLMQAPGSFVLGSLVESGIAYDTVFRGSAAAIATVVVVLFVLYRRGKLPTGG